MTDRTWAQALVAAAAVVAGLTREALTHVTESATVATLCMQLSLVLPHAAAAHVCAVASASIINKSGDNHILTAGMHPLFSERVLFSNFLH